MLLCIDRVMSLCAVCYFWIPDGHRAADVFANRKHRGALEATDASTLFASLGPILLGNLDLGPAKNRAGSIGHESNRLSDAAPVTTLMLVVALISGGAPCLQPNARGHLPRIARAENLCLP